MCPRVTIGTVGGISLDKARDFPGGRKGGHTWCSDQPGRHRPLSDGPLRAPLRARQEGVLRQAGYNGYTDPSKIYTWVFGKGAVKVIYRWPEVARRKDGPSGVRPVRARAGDIIYSIIYSIDQRRRPTSSR